MRKILVSNDGWSSLEENSEIQKFMLEYKPIIDVLEPKQEFRKIIREFEKELQYEDDPVIKAVMWESEDIAIALKEEEKFNNDFEHAIDQFKIECQEKFGKIPDTSGKFALRIAKVDGRVLILTEDDTGAEHTLEEKDAVWF